MRQKFFAIAMAATLITCGAFTSDLLASEWQMIGLRAGISDNHNDEDFTQYEGFAIWNLPWAWNLGANWTLATYLEANGGLLRGAAIRLSSARSGPALTSPG